MHLSKAGVYTFAGLFCIVALGYLTLRAHANVDLRNMRSAESVTVSQIDLYQVQFPEVVVCTTLGVAQSLVDQNFGQLTDVDRIALAYGSCVVDNVSNLNGTFKNYHSINVIGNKGVILSFDVFTFVDQRHATTTRFVIGTQLLN